MDEAEIKRRLHVRALKRMANDPFVLLGAVLSTWLLAGSLFVLLEGVSIIDGLYWSMTTLSTVGYGDLSPATTAGKVMTMVFQAWSIFLLVPCAIVNLIEAFKVDKKEFSHPEQEYLLKFVEVVSERDGLGLGPQPKDYEED